MLCYLCMKVVTGLPVRLPAPAEARPNATEHVVDYVGRCLLDETLEAMCVVPWASIGTLVTLVQLGLACCQSVPESRPKLPAIRRELVDLLEDMRKVGPPRRPSPRSHTRVIPPPVLSLMIGLIIQRL